MPNQFYPRFRYLNAITQSQNAMATCTADHDFTDGEYVSFRVTSPYGMFQINEKRGKVLSHTNDSITVDIDTSNWDAFIYPVSGTNTPPTVVPAGSGIIPNSNPPTVNLLDSFDNRRT